GCRLTVTLPVPLSPPVQLTACAYPLTAVSLIVYSPAGLVNGSLVLPIAGRVKSPRSPVNCQSDAGMKPSTCLTTVMLPVCAVLVKVQVTFSPGARSTVTLPIPISPESQDTACE